MWSITLETKSAPNKDNYLQKNSIGEVVVEDLENGLFKICALFEDFMDSFSVRELAAYFNAGLITQQEIDVGSIYEYKFEGGLYFFCDTGRGSTDFKFCGVDEIKTTEKELTEVYNGYSVGYVQIRWDNWIPPKSIWYLKLQEGTVGEIYAGTLLDKL